VVIAHLALAFVSLLVGPLLVCFIVLILNAVITT
jgi:hypothetical protein